MSKKSLIIAITLALVAIIVATSLLHWAERHKARAAISPCIVNLQVIQGGKTRWMHEDNKTTDDIPSWDDLKDILELRSGEFYRMTNGRPVCPQGGTYTLGRVGEPPTCSIGGAGHRLPK